MGPIPCMGGVPIPDGADSGLASPFQGWITVAGVVAAGAAPSPDAHGSTKGPCPPSARTGAVIVPAKIAAGIAESR